MYLNVNNPVNYQLQGFGQNGVRTISIDQLYIQGEYYRVLVAEEDSYVTAVSVLGDDLTAEFVYAGTTIYGLFTEVSVSSGSLTAYIAGPTDIEDVWAYINAYGQTNAARIEAADCAKDAIAPLLDKYYAKASLVMVPSLYKTSIVYSERPLTTDGQLAFTRSNDTATRVGPDGYIEKVRTNLILQSETFGNASWGKSLVTITDNFDTAPNGTLTADRFVSAGGAFPQIAQARTVVSGAQYTASLYVKSDGTTQIAQVIIIGGNTVSFTPTNTWQRITTTFTAASSSATFVLATNSAVAPASSFVIWGAQLETGDIATDYIPTTASAVSVGPVANLPRLNYPINSDGSVGCPSLLLEPQRTNNFRYSEYFSDSFWSKATSTITSNSEISPDGYQNADTLTPTSASTNSGIDCFLSTSASAHTMSIYAKVTSGTKSFRFFRFNSTDGSVVSPTFTATTTWQRFTWTTTPSVAGNSWYIVNAAADTIPFHIWGAQLEVGAYATSYIPTLGAAVTRGTDATYKASISTLIGQTEGVAFIDFVWNGLTGVGSYPRVIELWGDSNNYIQLFTVSGIADIYWDLYVGGATQASGNASMALGRNKIAIAYKTNDFAVYKNGTLIASDTSCTVPATSSLGVAGSYAGSGAQLAASVNQALLFKTRLTNQELQDLTTL